VTTRLVNLVPDALGWGEVSWTILADPEGNELCVLSPR
jgi:hypothetical protein